MVRRALPRLANERLLDMLARWGESALVQRLGYLIDLHGIELPAPTHAALGKLVHAGSKVLLGPRRKWGTHGALAANWGVIENVPRDVLLEKGEAPRRRVQFNREPRA
jgi:predicted transcriptional regulator of viral defense system